LIDLGTVLGALCREEAKFIVVGGVAAAILGSTRVTHDIDVVYSRTPTNLQRIVAAIGPLSPYLRGAPPGLPFRFDAETLGMGLNFTLDTTAGWIDLLGEIAGGGRYEDLLPHGEEIEAFGSKFFSLGIDKLIEVKRAAGRPKDYEAIAELEIIREALRGEI
jgi:predicted nucleotidyltransferase